MSIPRLLILSLLVLLCAQRVAAQFSPARSHTSSKSLRDGLVAPEEFRLSLPAQDFQGLKEDERPGTRLQTPAEFHARSLTLEQDDEFCLNIRSYRVTRDDPESDSTRLAGYSECQPAARYQMKTAVDMREIQSR